MKLILTLFTCVLTITAFGQVNSKNKKPMTEVTVEGKWYVILNKKTFRTRRALCNLQFNSFEFCQHPGEIHNLSPDYSVNTSNTCSCEGLISISNRMIIRVPTEKLHLIAITSHSTVNKTGDSIKIRLKKSGLVAIPLNYKGRSFSTIKKFISPKRDSIKSDEEDTNAHKVNFSYLNFVKEKKFIPSKGFPALDSTIFALRENKKLVISIVGITKNRQIDYNLSKYRINEVRRYLINAGVDPGRIKTSFIAKSNLKSSLSPQNDQYVLLKLH